MPLNTDIIRLVHQDVAPVGAGFPGEPVRPGGHQELEPCALLVLTVLPYRDTGDGENLPYKEQSKAGILPVPF